tara:strand:+ start:197 stop:661 length:465 start_codon:yes stop_codon:yes gene_type:complete
MKRLLSLLMLVLGLGCVNASAQEAVFTHFGKLNFKYKYMHIALTDTMVSTIFTPDLEYQTQSGGWTVKFDKSVVEVQQDSGDFHIKLVLMDSEINQYGVDFAYNLTDINGNITKVYESTEDDMIMCFTKKSVIIFSNYSWAQITYNLRSEANKE